DYSPCRPRKDTVFADKLFRRYQPASAGHEAQLRLAQRAAELFDVAGQDGIQVGVDDGRIAARNDFRQRRAAAADTDFASADFVRHASDQLFVFGILVGVQQTDRQRINSAVSQFGQLL